MVDPGKGPDGDASDGGASGSNNIITIDINDPLFIHSNDTNGTPLISLKLTGTKNYRVWTAALKHCIHSKNKLGFIDEKCAKPPKTSPFFARQWERCNFVVLTWILNCVSADLFVGQVFSSNDKTMTNIGVRNLAFFGDMLNDIGQLNIVASEDTCVWNLGLNGTFTVNDARNIIDQKTLPSLPSTSWDKIIPPKVNIFMWRLSLDRLPHRLNLSLRGMDIPAISCSSCNANVESANHIFFECIIASDL
ncbi:RNA-directed DNA polymerase, eukaryota [Tanacetum coccineum]